MSEMRAWFAAGMAKLPARSPTAEAIRYALNHWHGLCQFLGKRSFTALWSGA